MTNEWKVVHLNHQIRAVKNQSGGARLYVDNELLDTTNDLYASEGEPTLVGVFGDFKVEAFVRPSEHAEAEIRVNGEWIAGTRVFAAASDLPIYNNRDLTQLPLIERREILRTKLKFKSSRVRVAEYFETSVEVMLQSAREQGLEGVVAKRKDSRYEAGKRSGAWAKFRLNSGQELVVGGYIPASHGVDSIIVGYYKESKLIYVARVRNGFVPLTRRQVLERLKMLTMRDCPFANLPEKEKGRWGTGLTAEDMKKCTWVRPEVVARIEYLEWTDGDHLRHSKFAGLRDDKNARSVTKEHAGEA